jgi:hypothetical protein
VIVQFLLLKLKIEMPPMYKYVYYGVALSMLSPKSASLSSTLITVLSFTVGNSTPSLELFICASDIPVFGPLVVDVAEDFPAEETTSLSSYRFQNYLYGRKIA